MKKKRLATLSFLWIFNFNIYLLSVGGFAPTDNLTPILLCSFLILWLKQFVSFTIYFCASSNLVSSEVTNLQNK